MERVSFEVAKALKEAGYPQDKSEHDEGYAITTVYYEVYSSRDDRWYSSSANAGRLLSFDEDYWYPSDCGEYCVTPSYMEAWLWLCDRGIVLYPAMYPAHEPSGWSCYYRDNTRVIDIDTFGVHDNPEKSIAAALEYLVANNLIK